MTHCPIVEVSKERTVDSELEKVKEGIDFYYLNSMGTVKKSSTSEKALFSHCNSFVAQKGDYSKSVFWLFQNTGVLSLYSIKTTKS